MFRYFGFKVKYNWLFFLLTWWGALLLIAEIPRFIHEDNFYGTNIEILYYVLRLCAFLSWAILSGLLFFWGRRSERFVATSQYICLALWFCMVLAVIIIWFAGFQDAAVLVKNGVIGFC